MTDFERIAMEQWLEEEKHILEAESGFCLLTWGPSTNCKLFTVLPKMCKTMEKILQNQNIMSWCILNICIFLICKDDY